MIRRRPFKSGNSRWTTADHCHDGRWRPPSHPPRHDSALAEAPGLTAERLYTNGLPSTAGHTLTFGAAGRKRASGQPPPGIVSRRTSGRSDYTFFSAFADRASSRLDTSMQYLALAEPGPGLFQRAYSGLGECHLGDTPTSKGKVGTFSRAWCLLWKQRRLHLSMRCTSNTWRSAGATSVYVNYFYLR